MKKKILATFIVVLFPFLATDLVWLLTFGVFDLRPIFLTDAFWGLSIFYWVMFGWTIPCFAIWVEENK
jgi:hypothetical protein